MRYLSWTLIFASGILCSVGCGDDDDDNVAAREPDAGGMDAGGDRGREGCTGDQECSDGLYCNGVERCRPSAEDADERGCVGAESGPCGDGEGETCDEEADACTGCADDPDGDGDNHDSIACGGDDCDDDDPNRFPGNAEVCDEEDHDEDCDPESFGNRDVDADGSYDAECCNRAEDGGLNCGDDCDDTTSVRHPRQLEVCDLVDNDCDGETDEETNDVPWYPDEDGDGYGADTEDATLSCSPVANHSLKDTDCDDHDAARHPAQVDLCDGVDNNCDGETDEDVPCDLSASGSIGLEGGEVGVYAAGRMVLGVVVPAGALSETLEIQVAQAPAPVELPAEYEPLGPSYAVTPHGLSFEEEVVVILPLVVEGTEDACVLRLQDLAGAQWEALESVTFADGVAKVRLNALSYFQPALCPVGQSEVDGGAGDGGVMPGGPDGGDGGADGAVEPDSGTQQHAYACGGNDAECDLLDEESCAPGQGCQLLFGFDGQGPPFAQCVPAGDGESGDLCDEDTPCAPGFGCDELTGACHKYCCEYGSVAECPPEQFCIVGIEDADHNLTDVLFCDQCDACNPLTAEGCQPGQGCYPIPGPTDCRLCLQSYGELEVGDPCEAANDCRPGLGCYAIDDQPLLCASFCDLTATPDPCATQATTCVDVLGASSLDGTVGLCISDG